MVAPVPRWFEQPKGGCGGSFISTQHVITAQHCVLGDSVFNIFYNGHSYEAEVVAKASNDITDRTLDCNLGFTLSRSTDMAILRLKTVPNGCVIPICLPSLTDDSIISDNLTMASFRGGYHEKSIPVIDGKACFEKYRNKEILNLTECHDKLEARSALHENVLFKNDELSYNFVCSPGDMITHGDSGSPLMKKDDQNIWTLIGIVRGYESSEDDTFRLFADYQTIFPQLSWIHESMQNKD